MIATDKSGEAYISSLRSFRAALKDYLLLIGEPCPLLGSISYLLVEFIGGLPPGDEFQAETLDKLTATVLEAAVLGMVDRLKELRPASDLCLQSVDSCMTITKPLNMNDRCASLFKILGIAMDGLRGLTTIEYPKLVDGSEKELTGR
jgi:hypothetical protein